MSDILAVDACSRARVSRSELKGLGCNSPPRAARDMGSIALLSPVRADSHINRQLGAAKVIHLHMLTIMLQPMSMCHCLCQSCGVQASPQLSHNTVQMAYLLTYLHVYSPWGQQGANRLSMSRDVSMMSITTLQYPVVRQLRASLAPKLTQQPVQVVTPVRRSARKSTATPLIASMLRETEFAYAPNEALSRRRHPIFDCPAAASDAGTDAAQPDDDAASTPTSITGTSTALLHATPIVLNALSVCAVFSGHDVTVRVCACACVCAANLLFG